ncbi:unnamed protein product [Meloidogyne enterolobii]|uniref:Uncharacterized protein n=1 Tax=Meloidogyne enterolobii TaxID=390850 RepID=A0ACB0Z1D4_MELEN
MPNLCGVNQKQLSDALIEIKRSATTNTAPPSFANKDQQLVNGVGNKFKNLFRAQVSGGDSVADKSNEISEPLGGGNADSPRQYKLTNFHIHKVLGKGSFGKVGEGIKKLFVLFVGIYGISWKGEKRELQG